MLFIYLTVLQSISYQGLHIEQCFINTFTFGLSYIKTMAPVNKGYYSKGGSRPFGIPWLDSCYQETLLPGGNWKPVSLF